MIIKHNVDVPSATNPSLAGGGETPLSVYHTRLKTAHEFIEQNELLSHVILLKSQGVSHIDRFSFPHALIGEGILQDKAYASLVNDLLVFYIGGLKIHIINNCIDENGFPILTIE